MEDNIDPNIGKRLGIYNIIGTCGKRHDGGHKLYRVQCVFCGWESDMRLSDIKRALKCTHLNANGSYRSFASHKWTSNRLRGIFSKMLHRCYNPNDKDYKWYGGKGVRVYDEWVENPQLFERWALSNGYDDSLSIDRIDSSKGYYPENCRWITMRENSTYKSTTSLINVDGEIHSGIGWSKILGIGQNKVNEYIREYGLENTIEFIRRFKHGSALHQKCRTSYYRKYMQCGVQSKRETRHAGITQLAE